MWQVGWAHPKFGSLLASCSFDNRVIVWKEVSDNTWQQVRLQCHGMGPSQYHGRCSCSLQVG